MSKDHKKWHPIHIPRSFAEKIDALGPHFCIVEGKSPAPGGKDWQKNPMLSDGAKIRTWTLGGQNYGVIGGNGLVIADSDSREIEEAIEKNLAETLTVKTGSGQKHFYFKCVDCEDDWRPVLFDKQRENIGNIQGKGKMVVGPGSVHPDTGKRYKLYKNVDIALVSRQQIEKALKDYLVPKKVYSEAEIQAFKEKQKYKISIADVIDISKLLKKSSTKFQGSHPIHGSTGGQNFEVDLEKNCWFCFRHWRGGGPLSWLAVKHGIIKCEEAGPNALRGDKFKRILKIARKKGLIKEEVKPSFIYFEGKRFQPAWLARDIKQQYQFATPMDTKTIWSYHRDIGIWRRDGKAVIQAECERRLGKEAREHRIREVVFNIQISTYITRERFKCPLNLIAVKNGMLNLETHELQPFKPEYYAKANLPVEYDPQAECPKIEKFLKEVVGDSYSAILEYLGYTLYKAYIFHKALLLIGDGENGKSTLLNLITKFLGKTNVTSITLQDLCHNRFAPAQLYGKLADISADLPQKELYRTGPFKMATGHDRIMAEYKFKDQFPFYNYAKLIYSANEIPKTPDDTTAFFRRWLIIPCPNQFPTQDQKTDPNILQKITTPIELNGLLNLALKGLNNLLKNGQFTHGKTVEETREQYLRSSNSAQAFIEERVQYVNDPNVYTTKEDLYRNYIEWCKENGLPTKNQAQLTKNLKRLIPQAEESQVREDDKRPHVWKYIKVSPLSLAPISNVKLTQNSHKVKESVTPVTDLDTYFLTCFVCLKPIDTNIEEWTYEEGKPAHINCLKGLKEA